MTLEEFLKIQDEKRLGKNKKKGFLKTMVKAQLSMLKKQWQISKLFFVLQLIESVIDGVVPVISVYLSKFLVEKLLEKDWYGTLSVMSIILALNICNYIAGELISYSKSKQSRTMNDALSLEFTLKKANMDLELKENPVVSEVEACARYGTGSMGATGIMKSAFELISLSISLVSIMYLLVSVHFWILAMILVIVVLQAWITYKSIKWQNQIWETDESIGRERNYATSLLGDRVTAQEGNINSLIPWILKKEEDARIRSLKLFEEEEKFNRKTSAKSFSIQTVQNIILYLYMTFQVIFNGVTYADYTMSLAAVNKLSSTVSSIVNLFIDFGGKAERLQYYFEYMSLENKIRKDKPEDLHFDNATQNGIIDFKNVSFKYTGLDHYVLKHINLHIERQKFYVIVGPNGAGKSTFIKLLARLYDPNEGEITIGEKDIKLYNYREYHSLFSAIMQDYKIFDYSVAENVALDQYEDTDKCRNRVLQCLETAGISEKILSLENGIDTRLGRAFDDNGVYLSGGETQKVVFARVLYRNSDIIILDEPSSALDAFAENNLLEVFLKGTKGKTVFYISHRLSAAKYADKVIFINNGIVEGFDNHNNLLTNCPNYAEMYNAQARHYIT